MTGTNLQTNGASLEDCHTNFFALTDVCGIKWIVYRESEQPPSLEPTEDPVLHSFARCLEAELLSVWRRVPRRALLSSCSYDIPPPPPAGKNLDEKNSLSQRKELWIFWYGDKPEDLFKKLLSPQLTEVQDISGTWENVLPYEARTLLYKALQNVIERTLLSRDFVRLGKWFVQPFDGPEKSLQKASHLSFGFHYFVHGESHVCTTLDVRQHPAVRRLSLHHLNMAKTQAAPVQVVLAPYGLSASLTGVSYKANDQKVSKMLKDWQKFFPLDRNKYFTRNTQGEFVSMPAAVEVQMAGVRMMYPTCYVLVTDLDASASFGVNTTSNIAKAVHASRDSDECNAVKQDAFSIEPSPFTNSNHPLLTNLKSSSQLEKIVESEAVWLDGITVDPEAPSINQNDDTQHHSTDCASLITNHWNYGLPGRFVKKKPKGRTSSREKSKDRNRFNSKFPFHKKSEALDELAWTLDHNEMLGPGSISSANGPGSLRVNSNMSMRPPNSVRALETAIHSPASVGAVPTPGGNVMTPKGGPSSVRTPGDLTASLASPMDCKPPGTPKSVPPHYPVSSPYPTIDKKSDIKQDFEDNSSISNVTSIPACTTTSTYIGNALVSGSKSETNSSELMIEKCQLPLKRPLLPVKEYELGLGVESGFLSENLYDTQHLQHWLNHPVKKFRPAEQKTDDPLKPMYRRPSQSAESPDQVDIRPVTDEDILTRPILSAESTAVKAQVKEEINFDSIDGQDIKKEIKGPEEEKPTDLFTSEGLKPSMDDLDNLFEDSSEETEQNMTVPTPPGSNKPAGSAEDETVHFTKLKPMSSLTNRVTDPTGNLPHDQLAKMFPTPPSHEHNLVASPADVTSEGVDHLHSSHIKMEPASPEADLMDWTCIIDDSGIMLASSKFAPLQRLYSDDLPPLNVPPNFRYNPKHNSSNSTPANGALANSAAGHSGPNSVGTPAGLTSSKAGMSPISPLTSVEGPRSHHGPGSVGGGFHGGSSGAGHGHEMVSSPASVSSNYLNKSVASVEPPIAQIKTTEVSAIVLNLILSDSMLNLYLDHNFNSCTMCVCSNESNIRGKDGSMYLPDKSGDDLDVVNCMCGFSAVVNRRLAHHSGLFYEDETEATGITEDLYFRKKPSLLLDSKPNENLAEKTNLVDGIPHHLIELVQKQSTLNQTPHSSLVRYSKHYLKNTSHSTASISMVDMLDSNEVVFSALEQTKNIASPDATKLDDSHKGSCMHKWTLLQAPGPFCSEDIIRVMKALQPILNDAVHVKKSMGPKDSSVLSVQGPLTWRQFHRMAGPTTKGNTDDQCEPLPVPLVTVGHEKDFMSLSPLALHYWDTLSMEPFSQPRDVAYIVVAPDNELLLDYSKRFFKNLSVTYESCRLGRHSPITKVLCDGILKVGRKQVEKLANEDTEQWFDLIGDSPTASLVRLYSQVCRHYLLPLLHNLPMDKSILEPTAAQRQVLVEKPPASPMPPPNMSNQNHGMGGNNGQHQQPGVQEKTKYSDTEDMNGKENALSLSEHGNEDNGEGDTPAIVIYMVDPFSMGADENPDVLRLACLGLLRSFSQILPHLTDLMRHNIHLQLVSVHSLFELTQSKRQPKLPGLLRGLAFSVYSQAQRPLRYQRDCKTLTGFGPASSADKYLKENDSKAKIVGYLHCPAFILSPQNIKKKTASEADASGERGATVLFCNYFLSEDQHWLLASCCDDRGELMKTTVINIEIPNKTRRKRASARGVGLRKLMDWILQVMASAFVPWRLVIGRIGRIGHGELRGWSVLLSRKALKRASKDLREMCPWTSDVPSILSACLVSMEPDSSLRLMTDQFTPDERFGQTASNCQLSTPRDASCTHILVFPTSAKAQSSQKTFEDHADGMNSENDLNLGLDDVNLEDIDAGDGIGDNLDFKDLFGEDWGGPGGQPGSPNSPHRNSVSRANSPGDNMQEKGDQFRYGQEEPGDRMEILQQPLALGYLVSTSPTGQMPKWFWSSCPHLENVCPVFLKSALHINVASVLHGGDDGFTPVSSTGRVHSLDSTYTADVLRYVLEGYNSLSWLSLDHETHDRRSCLPLHVQILQQMYNSLASLF